MSPEQKNKQTINNLVLDGKLPLPFFNSIIIKLRKEEGLKKMKLPISKYKQIEIPRANSLKIVSKIYELF